MRSRVLTVPALAAVLLCGCAQGAPTPAPEAPVGLGDTPGLPATPANETVLGSMNGSGSFSSEFAGTGASAVAVYLACQSEGDVSVIVANGTPVTIPCGTKEESTRQLFTVPSPQDRISVDVESDGLVLGLVLTEARS